MIIIIMGMVMENMGMVTTKTVELICLISSNKLEFDWQTEKIEKEQMILETVYIWESLLTTLMTYIA